ncbi:molybdopterin cofactor-binding domain-containing protein [Agrobacterium vitis]|uniref:molybdopterin cofactor-binding domain-containing protein n=1 Tax=Agrobacterium vitis TaxID=373 RepID=UPI0020334F5F|nr:molybdopterin cofactor-binding domain-containing protein [Agrobacterium vitis]MCM2449271.1 molybdopterin-dependent oxidoreductase [Agrobacterium vitis]
MEVLAPKTLDLAIAEAQQPGARIVAGATALQLEWAKGLTTPERMISLSLLSPELSGIAQVGGHVRIGAMTTLADLLASRDVAMALPLLHAAVTKVASPAVRTLATLGGNIAGRAGCLLPALLALDAGLEFAGYPQGFSVSLENWLADAPQPAAILTAILIAPQEPQERFTFRKIGLRAAFSPSIINVAGRLIVGRSGADAVRFAVGGGIVPPARLREAEALAAGEDRIDWSQVHPCLIETMHVPGDAFRSAPYRRHAAANAMTFALGGFLPGRIPACPAAVPIEFARPPEGEMALERMRIPDRWYVRPDMPPKIRGGMAYLTDHREEGMLVGRILRAGVAHARILSIETAAAEALPGVVAVVTHRDVPGRNAFGIVVQDQPALCFDKVRHRGDPVAAVAAVDEETAQKALALINVRYEPLPVVDDMEAALEPQAEQVQASGNLQREILFSRGDSVQAFAKAAHIVEEVYVTPRQMHGFMETEGGYAFVGLDGRLNMCAGGQHGGRDRLQLSRILGLDEDDIRVVTSPTGGAFGGKDELSVQPALALLALKAKRPVRLHLSRAESMLAGQKRHPMKIRMKTACDAQGVLLAQQVDLVADAGAYASLGPSVLETALEHAIGPYVVANITTRGRLAYTNNGLCGAFRGFGANQMTFAVECQMDRLAALCGLSPLEIRRRNLRQPGSPGYLGQVVSTSERLEEMLAAAKASVLWRKPQGIGADQEWMIGTGMALNYQGNGLGSVIPDPAAGRLALNKQGLIEGAFGLDEMGQGLLPAICAAISTELGCARQDVLPLVGDTLLVPDSGSTTASRGSHVVWASVRLAAPEFRQAMCRAAAGLLGCDPEQLALVPGGFAEPCNHSDVFLLSYADLAAALPEKDLPSVTVAFDFPKTNYTDANARFVFAFGASLARVAVSRVTGEVRVLDLHQHSAAGPIIDLAAYLGQLEGGAVQGLGFTLTEDCPMQEAAYLTGNFDNYMLPGIQDAPLGLHVFALDDLDPGDALGPRGVGELGIGAVTPAIANAVAAATGYWPPVMPVVPETLLAHLSVSA